MDLSHYTHTHVWVPLGRHVHVVYVRSHSTVLSFYYSFFLILNSISIIIKQNAISFFGVQLFCW